MMIQYTSTRAEVRLLLYVFRSSLERNCDDSEQSAATFRPIQVSSH